ncbi:Holliday junction branch migration protein RuvA [Paracoccus sp. NSM]|uniref:Holliday junction branch migration protein RuvA n=1 Tax=Paracoccus sp. NSM TaxID=3457784 RepID=UPI0040371131
MIGRIAGIILHRARDHVLIDVRGVGYIVHVSERTAAMLPPVGQGAALYTELVVREDLLQLFGFPTMLEKEWHRLLTSVQGVGAKVSLAILGTLGPEGLGRAIALGDWASVRKANGVGPKLAQRIVLELKDKAPSVMALGGALTVDAGDVAAGGGAEASGIEPDASAAAAPGATAPPPPAAVRKAGGSAASNSGQAMADALSALANLGYGPSEAAAAVAEAQAGEPGASTPVLIRAALRLLAPKD